LSQLIKFQSKNLIRNLHELRLLEILY